MGSKPGPKPDPAKKDNKSWSVRCTAEQIEYLRWWLVNKGEVPAKPWGVKKK